MSGEFNHGNNVVEVSDNLATSRTDTSNPGDGTAAAWRMNRTSAGGTYEYVIYFEHDYQTALTTNYEVSGYIGMATRPGDVPASGSATYSGESYIGIATASDNVAGIGSSTVNADFGAGTVDVTMAGFVVTDTTTGAAATSPIDTLTVTGMAISGNQFNGGTVTTSSGGTLVDITGTNTVNWAQGTFYGFDGSIVGPDEVAGVVLTGGDDGAILADFIAD